ncbi:MAG: hypothetical protein KAS39_07860 [Actinomycetia bacterium]|nr:hypothetical protein [Actinomycetes bacterium]
MGIYFDYDFAEGKEVERWMDCYLCNQKKVLFVEYHIKNGPIYSLYNDARKLFSGKELKVGSAEHLICDDCLKQYKNEESIVSEILSHRTEDKKQEKESAIIKLESEVEETKRQIDELVHKLANLYQLINESKNKAEKNKKS